MMHQVRRRILAPWNLDGIQTLEVDEADWPRRWGLKSSQPEISFIDRESVLEPQSKYLQGYFRIGNGMQGNG
jgi:hypothetical protein